MASPEDSRWERQLEETIAGAAEVLSESSGSRSRLEIVDNFRPANYRATVLRCRVLGGEGGTALPPTVIVKRFHGDAGIGGDGGTGAGYDPFDSSLRGPRARFLNEWTGTAFLSHIGAPFGPTAYGGDNRLGLVVLEDLGEGECLADYLQREDPAQAERALLAYATTLGRLHAATIGREADFDALRRQLAGEGADPPAARMVADWLRTGRADFQRACEAIGLSVSPSCSDELASLAALVAEPGPFHAFSPGDTCPDNHLYVRDIPESLRFYDMEFGGFQHALLDAAYLWMPFPTCWCVSRLPDDLPERLEAAYRAELVRGCPAAVDDELFGRALAAACATWLVLTVAWSLEGVLERDEQWGISSVRQRFPLRAANFVRVARRTGHLPQLRELAVSLTERLLERWGDEADMPLYRPFRQPVPAER